jgi:hypothetical protein
MQLQRRIEDLRELAPSGARNIDFLPAVSAGKSVPPGGTEKQVDRTALRTDFAGDLERQFHFREGTREVGRGECPDNGTAYAADDLCLVTEDEGIQGSTAGRIAEARMRKNRLGVHAPSLDCPACETVSDCGSSATCRFISAPGETRTPGLLWT